MRRLLLLVLTILAGVSAVSLPAAPARPPLASGDIDHIAQLLMLEDTRHFDDAILSRLLADPHPEVRRRAVMAVAHVINPQGSALLIALRQDSDPEIVASVAFASGQLKDAQSVTWLGSLLASPVTPIAVAKEAACALGKIRSAEARSVLATYLADAPLSAPAVVVGEALLSFGRFPLPGDVTPILRWTTSRDVEIRWRAAWALFRPRDPAAIPTLLRMADDPSGDVRLWAVRGLAPQQVDAAKADRAAIAARLRRATADKDRRVRTEALRVLTGYDDDASVGVVLAMLDSPDTWLSVSAAETLGRKKDRAAQVTPRLVAATSPGRAAALRVTALGQLAMLSPDEAANAAVAMMRDPNPFVRRSAADSLGRLGAAGRAKLEALAADPAMKNLLPPPPPPRTPRSPEPAKPLADYRAMVERWIVPDYNGAPKPRTVWSTPKGQIEIELYPADSPIGMEHLVRVVTSGSIVGTEFTRVVPDFVDQQAGIKDASTLRDEVSRRGLLRGTLSWASAGLDTGRPGYTLGITPQPHNEGDFTAFGHVIKGMDVVDRLDLGDAITAATMRMASPRTQGAR